MKVRSDISAARKRVRYVNRAIDTLLLHRSNVEDRRARIAKVRETVGKRVDQNSSEVLKNRDPIAFLQRRSEALAQRSADLDKLAEAWQPLYKTLSPEQRQRMGALATLVLHDMSDVIDRRRAQSEDED